MDVVEQLRMVARAEAATARGYWPQAAAGWQQVVTANPVHGGYRARLAEARYHLGEPAAAADAYERAFEIGAWDRTMRMTSATVAYRVACCRCRAGEPDRALEWLARARDLGYRDLADAAGDEDLAAVRDDPRFREIVGRPDAEVDPEAVSRDEGWRTDLEVLARELKRRAVAPFRHRSEADFDAAVETLDRDVPELSDAQVVAGMLRLLRPLGDGHAWVAPPAGTPARPGRHTGLWSGLPVRFFWFEEGLYVVAAQPRYERLLGARLEAVDGRPTGEVLAAVDELVSRDNAYQVREATPAWLRRPAFLHALGVAHQPEGVTLSVRHLDGTTGEASLPADVDWREAPSVLPCPAGWRWLPDMAADTAGGELPLYLRHCGVPYWYTLLPDNDALYLQVNNVLEQSAETLPDFWARVFAAVDARRVRRLILDLRFNSGGNTFLAQSLLHRLIACDAVNRPGGLFVLIGRRTFSAAQNTATLIERHTHARFVGEPTGSSPIFVGETVPFTLPYSGLSANVSDLLWQTSWPMDHRRWIAPDVYAPPTFQDFRHRRDPALDAVLRLAADDADHLPGW